MEKVRVAIVGGGRTGTPLLEDFLDRPYIEVVGLADVNEDSPGAEMARSRGVFYTPEAMELAAKGAEIDLFIETSGDLSLKPKLKDMFQAQGNRHTIIVHDLVARLLISLVSSSDHLVETYHPEDNGI